MAIWFNLHGFSVILSLSNYYSLHTSKDTAKDSECIWQRCQMWVFFKWTNCSEWPNALKVSRGNQILPMCQLCLETMCIRIKISHFVSWLLYRIYTSVLWSISCHTSFYLHIFYDVADRRQLVSNLYTFYLYKYGNLTANKSWHWMLFSQHNLLIILLNLHKATFLVLTLNEMIMSNGLLVELNPLQILTQLCSSPHGYWAF